MKKLIFGALLALMAFAPTSSFAFPRTGNPLFDCYFQFAMGYYSPSCISYLTTQGLVPYFVDGTFDGFGPAR